MQYFRDGTPYKGGVHKHKDGTVMSGKAMTSKSKKLFKFGDLSDVAKKKARAKKSKGKK